MEDVYRLQRFVDAQDPVYEQVLAELRRGRKVGHWMWFVFPQIAGLGRSAIAQTFAVLSLHEAGAYVSHPVLGPRLIECSSLVAAVSGRTARQIFGHPDDMKLRSSMTLFMKAAPGTKAFQQILDGYFDGEPDQRTLDLLERLSALPGSDRGRDTIARMM
ncbi:MAG: DUF1810 domain-containing protein [Geodermatophilaceae bacterium]